MWRRLAGPWLSAPERGGRGLAALLPAGLRMAAAAAAAAGGGSGLAASAGLEAMTLQKLALRRKKVLSAEEMELDELAQAAGAAIDPDVFKILVDLLNLNVAPIAVYQMLKSMCAGQRLASDGQDPASVSLPTSETRGIFRIPDYVQVLRGKHVPSSSQSREKQRRPYSQWCPHTGRTQRP
uniref:mitotic-spindle organizing protein 2B isoform X2 n=1 Tax=Jaculus jaculus TaxID=51337 RepID=UPI001E1B391A|nr:mitotic-spindle organizing protein 2B isoform X2 [Jaculus jaculus]